MWVGVDRRIDLLLSDKWSSLRKAQALFDLQMALHLADGHKRLTNHPDNRLRVRVNSVLFRRARVLAASKLMEFVDSKDIQTWDLLRNREFKSLMGIFRASGGFKTLRLSDPRDFDEQISSWSERARNVGKLADISMRLPPPDKGDRRKNRITTVLNLFLDDQNQGNRNYFRLTLGRTKLQEYYARYKHVFPFTYATYIGVQKRSVMCPLRIHTTAFASRLIACAEDKEGIIDFCARYNEVASRLNSLGYSYQLISPPDNIVLPEVILSLKDWPKDITL
jgi:hypothetical protein